MSDRMRLRRVAATRRTGRRPAASLVTEEAPVTRAQGLGAAPTLDHDVSSHSDLLGLQRAVGNQAVQRMLTPSGGLHTPIQRKLAFENTQWAKTRYLDASSGGGGGVLFAGEAGREIVVKPGEEMAAEGALAALLQNEVAKSGKPTLALAPGFRLASPQEATQIKTAFTPLVTNVGENAPDVKGSKGKKFLNERAQALVGSLDKPGVVIQDMAAGMEFRDVIKDVKKHTKKTLLGGQKLRKESPLRIFKDERSIRSLGSATAVDLFTGNRDRLFQFNLENIIVTPYSLSMIDNIWMGTEMSYFQTTEVQGDGDKKFTITADEGLKKWKSDPQVKQLAAGEFRAIAALVWERVLDGAARDIAKTEKAAVRDTLKQYEKRFVKTFAQGLEEGKQKLIASLNRLLSNPAQLQKLVPGADLTEIMTTIGKRRDFLRTGK